MRRIFKKLNNLLDKKQKRQMAGLLVIMTIGAFLQTLGVGMLVQVVNVVIDPDAVMGGRFTGLVYDLLGFKSFKTFSIFTMSALIFVYIAKNLYLYMQYKLTYSFIYSNQFRTSERMLRNYIRRGYEFFLNADSAVVQRSITSDVNNMYALILSLLTMFSDGVVSLGVIVFCLIKSGLLTVILAVVMLIVMFIVKKVLQPIMHKAGSDNQIQRGRKRICWRCREIQPLLQHSQAPYRDSVRGRNDRIHDRARRYRSSYRKHDIGICHGRSCGAGASSRCKQDQQSDRINSISRAVLYECQRQSAG